MFGSSNDSGFKWQIPKKGSFCIQGLYGLLNSYALAQMLLHQMHYSGIFLNSIVEWSGSFWSLSNDPEGFNWDVFHPCHLRGVIDKIHRWQMAPVMFLWGSPSRNHSGDPLDYFQNFVSTTVTSTTRTFSSRTSTSLGLHFRQRYMVDTWLICIVSPLQLGVSQYGSCWAEAILGSTISFWAITSGPTSHLSQTFSIDFL